MRENVGDRTGTASAGAVEAHKLHDAGATDGEQESDAEAVAAERTGRTNTARDMTAGPEQGPVPGRWDSIGEPGEGLDELQGLYATDAASGTSFPSEGMNRPCHDRSSLSPSAATITPALWDQLMALEGQNGRDAQR